MTGRPLLPQRGAVSPAGVSAQSQNHAAYAAVSELLVAKGSLGMSGQSLRMGVWGTACYKGRRRSIRE